MGPFEAMIFLDASSYFWTRLPGAGGRAGERASEQGQTKLFLDASSWSGRPGGRAGEQGQAKLFLETSSYFWTRLPGAGGRAGGRAGEQGL